MPRTLLSTETIAGIVQLQLKNTDAVTVTFGSNRHLANFVQWLEGLREDTKRTPEGRYEEVRLQMTDSPDPACAE